MGDPNDYARASQCCICFVSSHIRLGYFGDSGVILHLNGLVQARRSSSALAMELRLSFINQSMCPFAFQATLENMGKPAMWIQ